MSDKNTTMYGKDKKKVILIKKSYKSFFFYLARLKEYILLGWRKPMEIKRNDPILHQCKN